MDFSIESKDERTIIRVVGEVTADNCEELREAGKALSGRGREVTIDLSQVDFMDTSGIGVLIGLRAHLGKHGITVRLENPQPRVAEVLRITRIGILFGME